MITYTKGNILESEAEALVNTVNTVGVMGKGIALQFKKVYPNNYKAYRDACKAGQVKIGKLFVFNDSNLASGEKIIVNFPTKKHWRNPSEYSYIEAGLEDLKRVIHEFKIESIAIPPLGAGNGGLNWEKVKALIVDKLREESIEILIYEPTKVISEQVRKERVKLTPSRALLLSVLYDLVSQGEYVSEFSSEKVCYFLQRFGAEQHLKLEYQPYFYGPYSGKVRFLLDKLNGSYIMGYSDMSKKPFAPLTLIGEGYQDVENYIRQNTELSEIAEKTKAFLNGFYSDFSLELLSSVDFIAREHDTLEFAFIQEKLNSWNDRKRSLFSNTNYLKRTITHINQYQEVL